jgi:hypothetical protein
LPQPVRWFARDPPNNVDLTIDGIDLVFIGRGARATQGGVWNLPHERRRTSQEGTNGITGMLCSIVYRMIAADAMVLFCQTVCVLLVALTVWMSGLLAARG